MTNYVRTNICEITDPDFSSMILELCHCVNLDLAEVEDKPLDFFLMCIGREKWVLTKQHLATNGVLTQKVDKLARDSVVDAVCREMAKQNHTHIESFDGKTVLTLIKKCLKAYCPTPPRPKKLTRRQSSYQLTTELIKRRRSNGDL